MAGAYKGLLKGLRYITSMFATEREPEMEIGGPTDVKHVAHIGWDGPTANAPSWMDKFKDGGGEGGGGGGDPLAQGEATEPQTKPRTTKGGKPMKKKKKGTGGPSKASAKVKTATEDVPDNDLEGE